jgi:hypothetical protein
MTQNKQTRKIYEIAAEIVKNWQNVYFGAVPYLEAMQCLTNVTDNYGLDSAESIILYFLSNANSWRGETARRIKKELKNLVGVK